MDSFTVSSSDRNEFIIEPKSSRILDCFTLRTSLFETLEGLGIPQLETPSKSRYSIELALRTCHIFQLLGLLISCNSGSDEYIFWTIFRYFRIEWLFHKLSLLWAFWLFAEVFVSIQLCTFGIAMASSKRFPKLFNWSIAGLRLATSEFLDMLIFPFITILIAAAKYSVSGSTFITEFELVPSDIFSNRPEIFIISVFSCISLTSFKVLRVFSCSQITLFCNSPYSISAFSLTLANTTQFAWSCIIAAYFILGTTYESVFLISTVGVGVFLAIKTIKHLPYSNKRVNAQVLASNLIISWAAISLIIDRALANSTTSFLLIIGISPFLLCLSYSFVTSRLAKIDNVAALQVNLTTSESLFKLYLRSLSGKSKSRMEYLSIVDNFNLFRRRCPSRSKMLDILEAKFCIEILKNEKLAYIKLCNLNRSGLNLEAFFIQSQIRKRLETNTKKWEEVEFLEFSNKLRIVKDLDKRVTFAYYKLWHEISRKVPQEKRISKCISTIRKNVNSVKNQYEYILYNYPESQEVYQLYCSFLSTVLDDKAKENIISLLQSRFALKQSQVKSSMKNFSCFGQGHGVIIICASDYNFSKIIFLNEKASEIFGCDRGAIIGSDINNFIPVVSNHCEYMRKFVEDFRKVNIKMPFNSFFLDTQGFLKDCNLIIKLTSLHNSPVFLVSLVERLRKREIAILDNEGRILAHSQKLNDLFGMELKGKLLEDLLPIKLMHLKAFEVNTIESIKGKINFALVNFLRFSPNFKLIFFFTDTAECKRWVDGNIQNDIIELIKPFRKESIEVKSISRGIVQSLSQHKINFQELNSNKFDKAESVTISKSTSVGNYLSSDYHQNSNHFALLVRILRLATLAFALAGFGGFISMQVYMNLSFTRTDKDLILQTLDQISTNFVRLGLVSKLLYLSNIGITLHDLDKLENLLKKSNEVLHTQSSNLINHYELFSSYGFEFIYEDDFLLDWHLDNFTDISSAKMNKLNLLDSLQRFTTSGSLSVRDLYHNYRNGLGECFTATNSTLDNFSILQKERMKSFNNTILLIVISSSLITISVTAIMLFVIRSLSRRFNQILQKLASVKVSQALKLNQAIRNRLIKYFGSSVKQELKIYSQDLRLTRDLDSALFAVNYNIWKKFGVVIGILLLVYVLSVTIFYTKTLKNYQETHELYNEKALVVSQLKIGSLYAATWTVESKFADLSDVQLTLNDLYPSAVVKLKDTLYNFKFQFNKLCVSDDIDSRFLLDNYFNSGSAYFANGLYPAILMFHQEISTFSEAIPSDETLNVLLQLSFEISEHAEEIFDDLIKEKDLAITAHVIQSETAVIFYSLGVCLLTALANHMLSSMWTEMSSTIQIVKKISMRPKSSLTSYV